MKDADCIHFLQWALPQLGLSWAAIAGRLAEVLVAGGLLLLGSHESLPGAVPGLVQERPWLHRREMP